MAKPVRTKNKDNARRAKKKISLLITDRVEYVDWKDVNLLRRFMSDRAKIRARRVSGNSAQQQAEIARAIKNAREMALLPYASRVTQTRGPKRDGERGGRRERDRDLPAPETEPLSHTSEVDPEEGFDLELDLDTDLGGDDGDEGGSDDAAVDGDEMADAVGGAEETS
jgi:small subunit ribosomal protein S18